MPLALKIVGPSEAEMQQYEEPPLQSEEVRVRSEFSAIKHGTELRKYRADSRDYSAAFDWERGIHREGETATPEYPLPAGNMTVGPIVEVGDGVSEYTVGDRVYGYLPIKESHTVSTDDINRVPEGMSPQAVVYTDPTRVGLYIVRTGMVRPGDHVAVFGAGAIGLMTMQLATLQGANWVAVSEPIERRRAAARKHGADLVIDPTDSDPGSLIRDATADGPIEGVDIALETSGVYAGLSDAIRATAFDGTIASCGYYDDNASSLDLAGEWHRNVLDIRSVRPPSEPLRDHPRWNLDRLTDTAFRLLRDEYLSVDGLVNPVVPLEEAAEGLNLIDERPAESIKLGITYDGE